ncbi:MAG TPA: ankyrin repeat domain-containing protein [Patescibacteria group bacterium]|nr:ankyrin repeat domain-containing protein [Patescibacteria group bacterium]
MSIFNKRDRATSRLGRRIYNNKPLELIRQAIDDGADIDGSYSTDWDYNTMLGWAVERDRVDVLELLLERGADPETKWTDNRPLFQAIRRKKPDAVQALIDGGASITVRNDEGETPLIRAVRENAPRSAAVLIASGADVDAQDNKGNTALHYAAAAGAAELVRLLMEAQADLQKTNANMNTAADLAAKDYPRIAEMIRGIRPQLEPATEAALPAEPEDGWKLTDSSEVARVSDRPAIGYRITEIFNFSARLYTQIARNLETNAESQSSQPFAKLEDSAAIEAARSALQRLGGEVAAIDKKKLPAPGQGL